MEVCRLLDRAIFYFFVLGQVIQQVRTRTAKSTITTKILYYTPGLIMLVATFALTTGVTLFQIHSAVYYGATDFITFFLVLITSIVTIIIVFGQSVMFAERFELLYAQFATMEKLTKLRFRIDLLEFRNWYSIKVLAVLFSHALNIINVEYITPGNESDSVVDAYLAAIIVIALLTYFHALFYISLLRLFLKSCSENIELTISHHIQLRRFLENFKFYKQVHFKLWEISCSINHLFGWSLIFWFLHTFIMAIYMAYWTFLYLAIPAQFHLITRNHLISLYY